MSYAALKNSKGEYDCLIRFCNDEERDKVCNDPLSSGIKPMSASEADEFLTCLTGYTWEGPFTYDAGDLAGISFWHTVGGTVNIYAKTVKTIKHVIVGMSKYNLVWLARDIDDFTGHFDGRFRPMEIGDLIEAGRDASDVAEACMCVGATDYSDLVREIAGYGWEPADDDTLYDDAVLWADDIAEWLIENWDEYDGFIYWDDTDAEKEVKDLVTKYWDWYFENDGKAA